MLAGQRLELDSKAEKKNCSSGFPIRLCFDGHAGLTIAPSGRYFKLDRRKLPKSAELSRTVLIESSISDSYVLDTAIESNQATRVLTFQVLEYRGVGGWLKAF